MSAGEMIERYGVSARMLRSYEDAGLLRPVVRGMGHRYSQQDELRLQVILKGRDLGFSLSEIGRLIRAAEYARKQPNVQGEASIQLDASHFVVQQINVLTEQRSWIDRTIADLEEALVQMAHYTGKSQTEDSSQLHILREQRAYINRAIIELREAVDRIKIIIKRQYGEKISQN